MSNLFTVWIAVLASATEITTSQSCTFAYWTPSDENGGDMSTTCRGADLSALPQHVYNLTDSYPDQYAVTSPCAVVPSCNSSAVQSPHFPNSCGLPLGYRSENSTQPLSPSIAADGITIKFSGGSNAPGCPGGRTLIYNFVCAADLPASNGPNATVGVSSGCTYIITWRTPLACTTTFTSASPTCGSGVETLPTPTAAQLRYQEGEIVALTHFNMATFVEDGDPGCNANNWNKKAIGANGPSGDPSTFNPTQLDTDQWASVYARVGVKGAVLTAKHGCGHLLWPTNVTLPDGSLYTYGVGKEKSAIKGDVLHMFSTSMQKANITHGFYYSFTNNFYLNVDKHTAGASKTILPGQVNVSQSEFEAIALAQVSELWSNYGSLGEIWFDGGYGGDVQAQIEKLLVKQPDAVGFGGYGVMPSPVGWVGTESGLPGGDVLWSTGLSDHGDPTSTIWEPKCCDTTLQMFDRWFYTPGCPIRSLKEMVQVYHETVGRNGVLELDFAIDRTGRVDPKHEARYGEFGDWIRTCYGTPVGSFVGSATGSVFTINLTSAQSVDRVVIRENQAHGQRIRAYMVEYSGTGAADDWKTFSTGTGVGNRFISVLAAPVKAITLRLTVTSALAEPMLKDFSVYAPCATPQ
eukprot:m.480671 g.480671  ORF g.480671 m.480671 type:complete len:634 (-) comp21709_c0_seq4:260-2161(-)